MAQLIKKKTQGTTYFPAGFVDSEHSIGSIQPLYWIESLQFNSQTLLSNLYPVCGFQYRENAVVIMDGLKNM